MGVVKMSDIADISARKVQVARTKSVTMSELPSEPSMLQRYINNLYADDGKLRTNKKLYEVLPSGCWKGRRCFIIGGGTSLRNFDFSQLKGELVITVNRAFENAPFSAVNLCQDARVWGYYENSELGAEARQRFFDYKGFKAWLNVQAFPFPEDIYQIDICHPSDFKWNNYSGGIPPYSNSGLNALCLAVCLGANPIYLLGFDMYGENGHTANYHTGYPDNNNDTVYQNFLHDFNLVAHEIDKVTTVINLNRKSSLKCFRFDDIENIPRIQHPIIVSFYTKDTGYQLEIKRLEKSVRRFGFEYDFFPAEDHNSWRRNIHERINILRNFLNKYPGRDIVYIDADGEIAQYPTLFDNFEADFGIVKIDRSKYWDNWKEWHPDQFEYLGGTMYLKNNARVRALLDLWEKLDKPMVTRLSQHTLIRAIEKSPDLKIQLLPLNYCQIFDTMAVEGEPVVEHFQASRRSILYLKIQKDGNLRLDFGKDAVGTVAETNP